MSLSSDMLGNYSCMWYGLCFSYAPYTPPNVCKMLPLLMACEVIRGHLATGWCQASYVAPVTLQPRRLAIGKRRSNKVNYNFPELLSLVEATAILYVDPQKMITRTQEIGKEKPRRELVLNQHSKLSLQDPASREQCQIQNELQLFQAFTRRSLACDLVSICTFAAQERWRKFLQDRLTQPPPPGFRALAIEQLLKLSMPCQARQKSRDIQPFKAHT